MTEGDQLLESMYQKTKIKALIDFNHREEIRKKIALYTLLILLSMWVVLEFKSILTETRVVIIENTHAAMVQAVDHVNKPDESTQREEHGSKESNQSSQVRNIEDKIKKAFPEHPEVMVAICKAESGCKTETPPNGNSNGSIDTGVLRINSIHGYSIEYLSDVDNNISAARSIYEKQGLQAWSSFNNNSFKKYL